MPVATRRLPLLIYAMLACVISANAVSKNYPQPKPYFEQNIGQTDNQVKFLQRGPDYTLFLTPGGTVLELQHKEASNKGPEIMQEAVVRMSWDNAAPQALIGDELQAGKVNYLDPKHSSHNIADVQTYGKVIYKNLYPNINLVYYSAQGELEHDLIVSPGGDPSAIALRFDGPDSLAIGNDGTLTAKIGRFQIHQLPPVAYQIINGDRQPVSARYTLLSNSRIGFHLGKYDHRYALVIDPILRYSTLIGGANAIDFDGNATAATTTVSGMTVDKQGNAYIAGTTTATDFPTTVGAFNRNAGADCERGASACASSTGFVTKLGPSGSTLVYSTYIATAPNGAGINALAVDTSGNAYFTSTDGCSDCEEVPVVLDKLNSSGTALVYGFIFGGSCGFGVSQGNALAVNAAGEAYIAGLTDDTCLPMTPGAFQQTTANDGGGVTGLIIRVNAAGTEAMNATYFGSTKEPINAEVEERIVDIKLDSTGNVYVTGVTATPSNFPHSASFGTGVTDSSGQVDAGFISKLDPTLSTLKFSTIVGGAQPAGLALDSTNEPYITGSTRSPGFPTTAGAFQRTFNATTCTEQGNSFGCSHAFITKLNAVGSALVFSSLLQGSANDAGRSIGVDSSGNAYVAGVTTSSNFPVTNSAFQKTYSGGTCFTTDRCNSGFVSMMVAGGTYLFYSTYLGGSGDNEPVKIFIDPAWNAYVAGWTSSSAYPTTAGAFQRTLSGMTDAFVSKVIIAADMALSRTGPSTVKHAANLTYTVQSNNNGPDPAFQVKVSSIIPAGTTFVSASSNVGTCTKPAVGGTGTVTCSIGTVNPPNQLQITVTVHVNAAAGTVLKETDGVSSITQDPVPANNTPSLVVSTTVD
jgi:uncharacterized repeat protein (TIGR01451 family)